MKPINHNRLLSALAKAGATITYEPHGKVSIRWRAVKGSNVLLWHCQSLWHAWHAQPKWDDKSVQEAVGVHSPSPHTDIMTDCFCDTFYHTIKSAVASLNDK